MIMKSDIEDELKIKLLKGSQECIKKRQLVIITIVKPQWYQEIVSSEKEYQEATALL